MRKLLLCQQKNDFLKMVLIVKRKRRVPPFPSHVLIVAEEALTRLLVEEESTITVG
jgi:hypothetical protein